MLDFLKIWSVVVLLIVVAGIICRGFGKPAAGVACTALAQGVAMLGLLSLMSIPSETTALWGQLLFLVAVGIACYWWWKIYQMFAPERQQTALAAAPDLDFAVLRKPKHSIQQCPYPHEHLAWE